LVPNIYNGLPFSIKIKAGHVFFLLFVLGSQRQKNVFDNVIFY